MQYVGYFKDIHMASFGVQIITQGTPTQQEITLADNPVIIDVNSSGLFSPLKPKSCTINIESQTGMFDLYTTNPFGVKVVVWNRDTSEVLFEGYATPCQYNQSWTTIDTISLECVDTISLLKQIPYRQIDATCKRYRKLSWIIGRCLTLGGNQSYDVLLPRYSMYGANEHQGADIQYVMENVYLNEANFFDDDDEQTPWTCYEVLEEVCKFLGMTMTQVTTPGNTQTPRWALIDYVGVANSTGNFANWNAKLMSGDYTIFNAGSSTQHTYSNVSLSKNMSFSANDYSGGSPDLSIDDVYNKIEVETNRYDIDEIATDMMDEDLHKSITKEKNFSGQSTPNVWTYYYGNWWAQIGIGTGWQQIRKYLFNRWCRLYNRAQNEMPDIRWIHHWWRPDDLSNSVSSYYSTSVYSNSSYTSLPQNRYINCLGGTFIHWAALDNLANKPTKLDWNDAIMFLCAHERMRDYYNGSYTKYGTFNINHVYNYEVKAFEYDSDYEMNFSPHAGKSWIVFNGKLWYQQNHTFSGNELKIVNSNNHQYMMTPLEDVANVEPYNFQILTGAVPTFLSFSRSSSHADYGKGFKLMKVLLKIGDKYWSGTEWTNKTAYFYLPFSSIYQDNDKNDREGFRCFEWMDVVSNTDYEDKVGVNGYCIPVEPTDDVCGQVHIELYNPTFVPHDTYNGQSYLEYLVSLNSNNIINWEDLSPCVFMKDFKIDYAYTDETEWYLAEEPKTDDVKYSNDTNTTYQLVDTETVKINSWQDKRPISKSYPIVDLSGSGQRQFLVTTKNAWDSGANKEQEYEIINKLYRHYQVPHKVYECNRKTLLAPYMKVDMPSSSGLNGGVYVIDSQSFDVRNRNNRVKIIEFGDTQIY